MVELRHEQLSQLVEGVLIGLVNGSDGNTGCSLESNELSKGALTLDNGEWSFGGSAQSWQPANKLNWVNISSDDDELSLLLFNEGGDLIQTELQKVWLSVLGLLSFFLGLGSGDQSSSLLFLGFSRVFLEQLEEGLGYLRSDSIFF